MFSTSFLQNAFNQQKQQSSLHFLMSKSPEGKHRKQRHGASPTFQQEHPLRNFFNPKSKHIKRSSGQIQIKGCTSKVGHQTGFYDLIVFVCAEAKLGQIHRVFIVTFRSQDGAFWSTFHQRLYRNICSTCSLSNPFRTHVSVNHHTTTFFLENPLLSKHLFSKIDQSTALRKGIPFFLLYCYVPCFFLNNFRINDVMRATSTTKSGNPVSGGPWATSTSSSSSLWMILVCTGRPLSHIIFIFK